ncbi:hypothetical protein [Burkholderia oklahomensis]|uniref:hypothetical protein n=1 Tax=Burkholderia oklahomensis TaxID=342113 RepID=UPI0011982912|nr:hypothetical protein [Burkholderia oklahomensis]QPS39633.1 hypothetical protein I6G57_27840 [Burkholderia oklahomensis]
MAKHLVVFTEEEFAQLSEADMVPLSELAIPESEKTVLLEAAKGKGANPQMVVRCKIVDDAVVCRVVKK